MFRKNSELAFLKDGFGNWKRAIERFKCHETSLCHRESAVKYAALKQQPIVSQLSTQIKQQQAGRRKMLATQIEYMSFLLRQGLAVRGHDNDEGNLVKLLELRSKDVSELKQWVQQRTYVSPDILSIMANTVMRGILGDIRGRKWFSVIAEETSDIANHEQFNITVRWVDDNFLVHEDPLGLIWVPETSEEILYAALTDALLRFELPINNCRGQAYDEASNMQGKSKGVATRISKDEPAAIHVHCLAHSLSLYLQEVSRQSKPERDALDLITEILRLIKWSPKRSTLFEQMKIEKSPDNPNLRKLCPVRWTMRTASVGSILRNYTTVMETLEKVNQTGTDEYVRQAGGQVDLMEKFSAFFGMKLSHLLFSASEQLSWTLQSKQTSAQDALKAASLAKAFYQRQRNDAEFEAFCAKIVSEASEIDQLEEPTLPQMRFVPRRIDEGSIEYQFDSPKDLYRQHYFEVIDVILAEIERRFRQPSFQFVEKRERLLIDSANGKAAEIPSDIQNTYGRDVDMSRVQLQLKMLPDLIRSECPQVKTITMIDTIVDAFCASDSPNRLVKAMMGEVSDLLQIYLRIPVTSSTSERSFSCLRSMKTHLRNTMTQERLNHVMTCHIYKERMASLDMREIAREFAKRNHPRVNYFSQF